jgi:hypothetical protein
MAGMIKKQLSHPRGKKMPQDAKKQGHAAAPMLFHMFCPVTT